jgi:hypothetical protein
MQMTGHSYSSGEWLVRPGSEEEFIEAWTTFVEWSLDNAEGLSSSFWFGARKSQEVPLSGSVGEPTGSGGVARDAPDAGHTWPVPGAVRRVRYLPIHLGG